MTALAYPLFVVMHRAGFAGATAAQSGLAIVEAIFISSAIAAGVEMFGTRNRYTGFSIGYNVSAALFGGTAPYVAIWLMDRTGNPMAPGLYLAAAAAISLVCVLGVRDMAGQPLPTDAEHPFPRPYNGSLRES
jgi:MFS transporter, MHS family, proline/betaine transporter